MGEIGPSRPLTISGIRGQTAQERNNPYPTLLGGGEVDVFPLQKGKMGKYSNIALVSLAIVLVLFVFAEGYIINPRTLAVRLSRKKTYPSKAEIGKLISPNQAPEIDWEVTRPNVTVNTMVFGGLGNTLMAYAVGCEASRRLGLRPPTLVIEPEGEFDFHRIGASKHGFQPTSVNELLPWVSTSIMNSGLNVVTTLNHKSLWTGIDYENISLKRNIIQVTNYEFVARVSDASFDFVRRSINREIYDYIAQYYGDLSDCMAVHLRMGQPTDWFAPPHPDPEDILEHYRKYSPKRVMVFTDSKPLAEEMMIRCELPGILWVGESGPIELFMIGACSSAVISHSTFSVMGCRLFGRKNVSISVCRSKVHFKNMLDESWNIIPKVVDYTNGIKK